MLSKDEIYAIMRETEEVFYEILEKNDDEISEEELDNLCLNCKCHKDCIDGHYFWGCALTEYDFGDDM